uniref:Hypotheticial protein n=1 Tax=Strongyloides venezuelensis TaxID=75913 RepID=A0A0K0FY77_STRVS
MKLRNCIFYVHVLIAFTGQHSSTLPTIQTNDYVSYNINDCLKSNLTKAYSDICIKIHKFLLDSITVIYQQYEDTKQQISKSMEKFLNSLLKIDTQPNEDEANNSLINRVENTPKNDNDKYIRSI